MNNIHEAISKAYCNESYHPDDQKLFKTFTQKTVSLKGQKIQKSRVWKWGRKKKIIESAEMRGNQ